jgi:hypothetical protein
VAAPLKFIQAVVAYRTIFVKIPEFVGALPEQFFMDIDLSASADQTGGD